MHIVQSQKQKVILSDDLLFWSWKRDSNTRPADYESAALPTELFQRFSSSNMPASLILPQFCPSVNHFFRNAPAFSLTVPPFPCYHDK